jgi:hypothetical protein
MSAVELLCWTDRSPVSPPNDGSLTAGRSLQAGASTMAPAATAFPGRLLRTHHPFLSETRHVVSAVRYVLHAAVAGARAQLRNCPARLTILLLRLPQNSGKCGGSAPVFDASRWVNTVRHRDAQAARHVHR